MSQNVEMRMTPKLEMLFEENIPKFNQLVDLGRPPDLKGANLSGLDLRQAKLKGLDLGGCYLRGANLRGLDLTGCNLQGASMQGAFISGAFFPENVPVEEIRLSVEYGTRIRTCRLGDNSDRILKVLARILHEIQKETPK
ncbi:MAG: pentapeptide repeat-containing protein [Pseudomonadota bacterium]